MQEEREAIDSTKEPWMKQCCQWDKKTKNKIKVSQFCTPSTGLVQFPFPPQPIMGTWEKKNLTQETSNKIIKTGKAK